MGLLVASVVTNDIAYATNRPSCSTRSHLRVRSLGQDGLPTRYGFDKSRDYRGRDPRTGVGCDFKAIAGVASGKQYPDLRAVLR